MPNDGVVKKRATLNGQEKSALLINTIGDESAAEIFKHLKDNDIRKILSAMARMRKAPVSQIRESMLEFYKQISEVDEVIFGAEYTKEEIISKLGEDRARMIFGAGGAGAAVEHRTLEALEMVDVRTLANYLTNEHPQTVALVIAHLPPEKKTDVLRKLPDDMQGEIVLRMANLDYVSPEMIEQVDEVLKMGLATMGGQDTTQLGGIEQLAEMFNLMDKNTEQSVMGRVEEKDPLLAEEIRKLMFVFDDLVKVDDRGIGLILKEVNNDALLKALKNAPDGVKEKIFRNMSKRGSEMIRADLETMGPIRVSDAEGAQQQMVSIARRLEEEGKIFIDRGGDGDGLV